MTIEFVKDVSLCVPSEPQYLRVIRQIAMVVGAKADLPLDCLDEGQLASDEAANILMKFAEPNAALYFDWDLSREHYICALGRAVSCPNSQTYLKHSNTRG